MSLRRVLVVLPLLIAACSPAVAPAPPAPAPSAPVEQVAAPPATARAPVDSSELQRVLDAVAARNKGRVGVVVKHLGTGEEAALDPRGQFKAASLYKLFVLREAFARIDAGKLSSAETLRLGEQTLAREPYAEWPLGTQTTVDCALQSMVELSHNAATAMLIDRLGGEDRVTDGVWALGRDRTVITAERAYTSPADVAWLLESIYRKEAVSPAASEAMLALLAEQQRNDRLPLPLPPGVAVAHKTGELSKLRHDAGIVFAPSGAYLLVAMVQDAPSDAAARQTVVDLSRSVYEHFEKSTPSYHGLAPRLAGEVLQTPDEKGRLAPLADEWAQTLALKGTGVSLAQGAGAASLRDLAVPDLLALQRAASGAGANFWVTEGYEAPSGADAAKALPTSVAPCRAELPPPKPRPQTSAAARPAAPAAQAPAPHASQQWLGTTVALSDSPTGEPTVAAFAPSVTGKWLLDHAWEYGFVPALPETAAGTGLGYEPWTLRWVGRDMAAHLRARTNGDPRAVGAELAAASRELALQLGPDARSA